MMWTFWAAQCLRHHHFCTHRFQKVRRTTGSRKSSIRSSQGSRLGNSPSREQLLLQRICVMRHIHALEPPLVKSTSPPKTLAPKQWSSCPGLSPVKGRQQAGTNFLSKSWLHSGTIPNNWQVRDDEAISCQFDSLSKITGEHYRRKNLQLGTNSHERSKVAAW